eukprot:CAMPEP_0206546618 /NCGR_PEP_ID=MMETSP0325_2-20121206/12817_1 /ASSEMBLY_ACC=CAM_ASM_000347 /TAXON_ID=2866 /ORGANISM="Crypthecodinium cohnii, Strain Seligo" /LENGTH=412 /DNA_ID=CAMNT_0054045785 /DNA_START=334 /DNA_END=1569 /DNA_ORIENTATION=+
MRAAAAYALLSLLLLLLCPQNAVGKSILNFPGEVRQRNVVRATKVSCEDCETLEGLYKDNSLVFVLFYERSLVGRQYYKQSIIDGFHAVCNDLSWSRVVCAAVDMVDDKAYALQYIDPKTAPAHIVVQNGQPLQLQKHHLERLMSRPGDKESILWHLHDITTAFPIDISVEARTPEAVKATLKAHRVVLVFGVDRDDEEKRHAFRAAAQRLTLSGEFRSAPGTPTEAPGYLLGLGQKALQALLAPPSSKKLALGSFAVFLDGKLLEGEEVRPWPKRKKGAKSKVSHDTAFLEGEGELVDMMKEMVLAGLKAAAKTTKNGTSSADPSAAASTKVDSSTSTSAPAPRTSAASSPEPSSSSSSATTASSSSSSSSSSSLSSSSSSSSSSSGSSSEGAAAAGKRKRRRKRRGSSTG